VGQAFFIQLMSSINPLHNLHGTIRIQLVTSFVDPMHKLFCFFDKANTHQGVQGKSSILDPGITIIPVSFSSNALGQAAGGCSNNGTGGSMATLAPSIIITMATISNRINNIFLWNLDFKLCLCSLFFERSMFFLLP